ncbi:MAG: hypothetical protein WC593_13700 [Methanoregula sp.]
MSRGKRPVVAIGEAKRAAVAAGFILIELKTVTVLPFDFVVRRDGVTIIVRVRRLKQAGFRIENILSACEQQIQELRDRSLMKELIPELWVRGPARAFHRYRVLPETVQEIGIGVKPPETVPEVKSFSIIEDPVHRDSPSRVIGIPYEARLPATPIITQKDPGPELTDGMGITAFRK